MYTYTTTDLLLVVDCDGGGVLLSLVSPEVVGGVVWAGVVWGGVG